MPLNEFTTKFAKLNADRGKKRYPALTRHRAPHKPLLLLSIMDLTALGAITKFSGTWYPGFC
jgi:hypothetical protein